MTRPRSLVRSTAPAAGAVRIFSDVRIEPGPFSPGPAPCAFSGADISDDPCDRACDHDAYRGVYHDVPSCSPYAIPGEAGEGTCGGPCGGIPGSGPPGGPPIGPPGGGIPGGPGEGPSMPGIGGGGAGGCAVMSDSSIEPMTVSRKDRHSSALSRLSGSCSNFRISYIASSAL